MCVCIHLRAADKYALDDVLFSRRVFRGFPLQRRRLYACDFSMCSCREKHRTRLEIIDGRLYCVDARYIENGNIRYAITRKKTKFFFSIQDDDDVNNDFVELSGDRELLQLFAWD